MLVIDTNVLVRQVVQGSPEQVALAEAALLQHVAWIPVTVLLEAHWVLSSRYKLGRGDWQRVLTALMDNSAVALEDEAAVAKAAQMHANGADFADALHLARSQHIGELLTFDAAFCKAEPGVRLLK